jgi:hypothetical protein
MPFHTISRAQIRDMLEAQVDQTSASVHPIEIAIDELAALCLRSNEYELGLAISLMRILRVHGRSAGVIEMLLELARDISAREEPIT